MIHNICQRNNLPGKPFLIGGWSLQTALTTAQFKRWLKLSAPSGTMPVAAYKAYGK